MNQTLQKVVDGLQQRALREGYDFKEPSYGNDTIHFGEHYTNIGFDEGLRRQLNGTIKGQFISFKLPEKSGPPISTIDEMKSFLNKLAEELQVMPTQVRAREDTEYRTLFYGFLIFIIPMGKKTMTVSTKFDLVNDPMIFGKYSSPLDDSTKTITNEISMIISIRYECWASKK